MHLTIFFLYLDPGTGSLIMQALIAGALGISMFFKNIKYYILSFFDAKKGVINQDEDEK
jgi:hypothetical protein